MRIAATLALAFVILIVGCAPAGSASLHDVVLVDEARATRLRYAYGNADGIDLGGERVQLGELVANTDEDAPFRVAAARQLGGAPYLEDSLVVREPLPFELVRIPLTTDLELRALAPLAAVYYFDGTRWFELAGAVDANVTRRITPRPIAAPFRGDGALTPGEADALARGLALDGAPLAAALLQEPLTASADGTERSVFLPRDPGGLEEYLHTDVYVQREVALDPSTYRAPGRRAVYEVVATGSQGVAPNEDQFLILGDADALRAFWNEAYASSLTPPATPDVRFGDETLIAVRLAARPSSGYGVRIDGIERQDGELFVSLTLTQPGEGTINATVMTSPWLLVRVLGLDANVVWFRDSETDSLFAVARPEDAPF